MYIITGVFDSVSRAEQTVRDLLNSRFTDDKIGIIVRDSEKGAGIADDLGREYRSGDTLRTYPVTSATDVYETMPDSFVKAVHDGGLKDTAIDWYRKQLGAGMILVTVDAGNRSDDARRIFQKHDGKLYSEGMTQPGMTQPGMAATTMGTGTETKAGEVHVPYVDEEVAVEKTTHQVGEVRVTPESTRETVEVPTTVMHEEIRVERRKLDHPMRPEDYKGARIEEGAIRMPIVEEEVRVTKTPVIREELIITRIPVSEQKTLRETVMHEEPHVETTGTVPMEKPTKEEKRRPAA